jgi:hypothetical protein
VRGLATLLTSGVGVIALAQAPPQPQFTDRVDVSRIVVDARPLDGKGNAILGLTADDFAVRIGNKAARVESATWVGAESSEAPPLPIVDARLPAAALERGRVFVLLFD